MLFFRGVSSDLMECSSLHFVLQQRHLCCKLLFLCFFTLCEVGHTLTASIAVLGLRTNSSSSSSSILTHETIHQRRAYKSENVLNMF